MTEDRCDLLCLDLPRAEELRQQRLELNVAERVAARMRALADPTRVVLVAALQEAGELCGCDLAWISERPPNLVSHHLRALKSQGLARSRREGKIVFYSLTEDGVRLFAEAVETTIASSARAAEASQ
jgi:ArsR family transcriptional regulator, lead/cadmium/zinc/bismuth-responsive transcriptional repressor